MRSEKNMGDALTAIKILSHPLRLSILCHLIERGEMSAGEIVEQEKSHASQSQISQYLQKLRKEKIVTMRKEGLFVYYTIACPKIRQIIALLHELYCSR